MNHGLIKTVLFFFGNLAQLLHGVIGHGDRAVQKAQQNRERLINDTQASLALANPSQQGISFASSATQVGENRRCCRMQSYIAAH